MDETEQTHLSSTKPVCPDLGPTELVKGQETFGATAKGTPPDPAGPSYPCPEDAGHKDRCWSVPVVMAAAAFFLLLPQSCFGLIFVQFVDKFGVSRESASWPQNVASMVSHLAGIPAFFLEQFLSTYNIVLLSAVLSSLALIGSAFSPNMAWMTVTFGLVQGFGYGLFVLASTVYTLPYFDKYQAFASSIKFGTWGLAGIIGPFIVSGLVRKYALNGMLLMFGAFNLQTIPIIMFAKNPSPINFRRPQSHTDSVTCDAQSQPVTSSGSGISHEMRPRSEGVKKVQAPGRQLSDSLRHALRLFKMPGFYVLLVTSVAGDYAAVEFGTTIVDYGLDKAIRLDKAQTLTTFLFSGELAGRLVIPLLADVSPFSRRPLYALSFLCMFTCMTALPHVSNFPGVVSLCVAQGIAQGYGICIKYVLVADFLGIERAAACFGMVGVAMAPLSLVSPRIIGAFRDARGSYDGFYQALGAVSLAAGVLFGTFALWHRVRRNANHTNIDLVVCTP